MGCFQYNGIPANTLQPEMTKMTYQNRVNLSIIPTCTCIFKMESSMYTIISDVTGPNLSMKGLLRTLSTTVHVNINTMRQSRY